MVEKKGLWIAIFTCSYTNWNIFIDKLTWTCRSTHWLHQSFDRVVQHWNLMDGECNSHSCDLNCSYTYVMYFALFFFSKSIIYRSNNRGNWDKHPIAASRFGSPGPTGSGNSRVVKTDPGIDNRNWGRDDISCEMIQNSVDWSNTLIWVHIALCLANYQIHQHHVIRFSFDISLSRRMNGK